MIGYKERVLKEYVSRGLNVHSYIVPKNLEDLLEYAETEKHITIRFDTENTVYNLPFFVFDSANLEDCINIWEEACEMKCNLIVSNGHKFESDALFNAVIEVDRDLNFKLDASYLQVTLREMYDYKVTSVVGNALGEYTARYVKGVNINKLLDTVLEVWERGLYNTPVELTRYASNVGMLNEKIIYW